MKYLLGMDVGGTKTHCLVAREDGAVTGFGAAGCGSYEYHGVERALCENENAVNAALASAGIPLTALAGVGLGVAGADVPANFVMLEERVYTPLFGAIPRAFKNDSFAALRGGTRDPFGIAVACGTDSVCAGRNRAGDETRVGGFGPEFGNQCSGTLIGREGLCEVWRARDGIVPPTRMTEIFVRRSGLRDVDQLFDAIYTRALAYDALEPMATVVFEAAVEGDAAACDILNRGGRFLAAMVSAVARELGMTAQAFDVVMAGSVLRDRGSVLSSALRSAVVEVSPKARCVPPVFEPVVGALLMAFDAAKLDAGPLLPKLEASLDEIQSRFGVTLKGQPA